MSVPGLIDAGLFFARIRPGQRFQFQVRPGRGRDVHAGLWLTCTGPPVRDGDGDMWLPFRYPEGAAGDVDGALWRSVCDRYGFEIENA